MGHYDRVAAANYAIKWSLSRNPDFKDFSDTAGPSSTHGGDCTNFVSQCLLAGGWEEIGGLAHDPTVWNQKSNSWASPQWFNWFLNWTDRAQKCDRDDLQVGDIMLLNKPSDKGPHHAAMVTFKSANEVYFSAHSINRVQQSLTTYESLSPSDEFIFWHIVPAYSSHMIELEDLSPALMAARLITGR